MFHLHDYEFCDGIAVKEKISSAHRQRRFLTFIHFLNINKLGGGGLHVPRSTNFK